MTITCYLATVMVDAEIDNDIKMHLRCGPFWRPCGCAGAIQMALPDAACPGLPRKPLDAAIGQLLAPYCPSGHQGNSKQNNDEKYGPTLLAILIAAVVCRYDTVHIAQWRRSLEATGRCHQASIVANSIKGTWLHQFYLMFFIVNTLKKVAGWVKGPGFQ